jgi:methyltransferase (TIGR00027 family)
MTRTDNDTWDIATSVGATAVGVAAARASETASDDPLISDPYAAVLVSTPELEGLMGKMASMQDKVPEFAAAQRQMVDYQAARTHFFDAYFAAAASAGIRQHVILAAGLDSRAYRLPWPDDTTVFEIDQPKVLEYKSATLAAHGVQPTATCCHVAVDLRLDWPKALQEAGFDPAKPTGWLAEGLLAFLPAAAQDAMFANIDSLSAPGSRIAVEDFSSGGSIKDVIAKQQARMQELVGQLDEDQVYDLGDLWYDDDGRSDPADWFTDHAWQTQTTAARDYLARLGRPLAEDDDELFPRFAVFVVAAKS